MAKMLESLALGFVNGTQNIMNDRAKREGTKQDKIDEYYARRVADTQYQKELLDVKRQNEEDSIKKNKEAYYSSIGNNAINQTPDAVTSPVGDTGVDDSYSPFAPAQATTPPAAPIAGSPQAPQAITTEAPVVQTPTPAVATPVNTALPSAMQIKNPETVNVDAKEAAANSRAEAVLNSGGSLVDAYKARDEYLKNAAKADTGAEDYGPQDELHLKAMKNLGMTLPSKPLEKKQKSDVDKLAKEVSGVREGARQGITTMNTMLNLNMSDDGIFHGPLSEAQANIATAFADLTDTEVSERVTNTFNLMKQTIQTANAQMRSLGGSLRPGIGLANLEKMGAPNPGMDKAALTELATQYLAGYRAALNHSDALLSGPADTLSVTQRVKLAQQYDDANPFILGDGKTLNPDALDFQQWLAQHASGTETPKGATLQDVSKAGGVAKGQDKTPEPEPVKDIGSKYDHLFE